MKIIIEGNRYVGTFYGGKKYKNVESSGEYGDRIHIYRYFKGEAQINEKSTNQITTFMFATKGFLDHHTTQYFWNGDFKTNLLYVRDKENYENEEPNFVENRLPEIHDLFLEEILAKTKDLNEEQFIPNITAEGLDKKLLIEKGLHYDENNQIRML